MYQSLILWLGTFLVLLPTPTQQEETTPLEGPHIQVALLLDTSNSMDGLIEQAKSQLWKMVNELATTKKNGQTPTIQIALYEYGNDGLDGKTGYIRQVSSLTADLDLISEKLFGLTTNGGSEFCGYVISDATTDLTWSDDNGDMKMIIIAGNEPFDQGPVSFRDACKKAIAKGIVINTIFCGNYQEGINTFWKEGADCADGQYFNIDSDAQVVHVPTPYDSLILDYNNKLNGTYIGYGSLGAERKAMQAAQDENAAVYSQSNAAERASYKAKETYKNEDWDLVDAAAAKPEMLEELPAESLPAELQGKSDEEVKAYVEAKSKERKEIQEAILDLEKQAREYREQKLQEMSGPENTLDKVISRTIEEQADKKGFKKD